MGISSTINTPSIIMSKTLFALLFVFLFAGVALADLEDKSGDTDVDTDAVAPTSSPDPSPSPVTQSPVSPSPSPAGTSPAASIEAMLAVMSAAVAAKLFYRDHYTCSMWNKGELQPLLIKAGVATEESLAQYTGDPFEFLPKWVSQNPMRVK